MILQLRCKQIEFLTEPGNSDCEIIIFFGIFPISEKSAAPFTSHENICDARYFSIFTPVLSERADRYSQSSSGSRLDMSFLSKNVTLLKFKRFYVRLFRRIHAFFTSFAAKNPSVCVLCGRNVHIPSLSPGSPVGQSSKSPFSERNAFTTSLFSALRSVQVE